MIKASAFMLLLVATLALLPALTYCQGVPGPPSFPANPKQAPIDGGLGILAVAGGAYAYKKLKSLERE